MNQRLKIRACGKSCQHYLIGGRCTYEDFIEVVPQAKCHYELLTENSASRFYSPEEILFRRTFGAGLDITLAEAREQLASQSVKR